jgi:hypothetical protein
VTRGPFSTQSKVWIPTAKEAGNVVVVVCGCVVCGCVEPVVDERASVVDVVLFGFDVAPVTALHAATTAATTTSVPSSTPARRRRITRALVAARCRLAR